ncbi:MAG: peptide chain release factor N(5)-glutamine methyltransferase [Azovibrio sp.]|uniref:peptide chain release factor N(5)-glutamine methyltransferase n=1 Tax=Azovibrio sp. TaxID=1872673 RepID=UPI003C768F36
MRLDHWLQAARRRIDTIDARLLLQQVTGLSRTDLITRPETLLTPAQEEGLESLVARRAAGEPLAYLLGEAGFRGRRFQVSPAVLVPRPETEALVDLALAKLAELAQDKPRVLDLGTGSGAISICLALECPVAQVSAVDVSPAALAVARANGEANGARVCWHESDWFAALGEARFHLIVSNPPYIHAEDAHLAGDGLRFEPRLALTDEADGLACIRRIVADAPSHLEPGGWLLFEHGWDQGEDSRNLLTAAGFKAVQTWQDLAGHDRISAGQWLA